MTAHTSPFGGGGGAGSTPNPSTASNDATQQPTVAGTPPLVLQNLREEMELKRKAEIDDIERRKTEHIKELMAEHDKAFQDIREYYNDITSNNLELIKNLKVHGASGGAWSWVMQLMGHGAWTQTSPRLPLIGVHQMPLALSPAPPPGMHWQGSGL